MADFDRDKLGEQLSAYLDGELDDRERMALETILEEDPRARAELEKLRETSQWLGQLPRKKAPAALAREVVSQLEDTQPNHSDATGTLRPIRMRVWLASFLATAAVVALLVTAGLWSLDRTRTGGRLGPVATTQHVETADFAQEPATHKGTPTSPPFADAESLRESGEKRPLASRARAVDSDEGRRTAGTSPGFAPLDAKSQGQPARTEVDGSPPPAPAGADAAAMRPSGARGAVLGEAKGGWSDVTVSMGAVAVNSEVPHSLFGGDPGVGSPEPVEAALTPGWLANGREVTLTVACADEAALGRCADRLANFAAEHGLEVSAFRSGDHPDVYKDLPVAASDVSPGGDGNEHRIGELDTYVVRLRESQLDTFVNRVVAAGDVKGDVYYSTIAPTGQPEFLRRPAMPSAGEEGKGVVQVPTMDSAAQEVSAAIDRESKKRAAGTPPKSAPADVEYRQGQAGSESDSVSTAATVERARRVPMRRGQGDQRAESDSQAPTPTGLPVFDDPGAAQQPSDPLITLIVRFTTPASMPKTQPAEPAGGERPEQLAPPPKDP